MTSPDGRPRLVLHIGAGKCGSSAIQQFLLANRHDLRKRGVLFPGRNLEDDDTPGSQQLQFFEDNVDDDSFPDLVRRRLLGLHEIVMAEDLHTVIISAENLINPKPFPRLFAGLRKRYDIRVVVYVRRQDDYVVSGWQQWHIKRHTDFWDYYGRIRGRIDWHRDLERWKQIFGLDAITVRNFSSRTLIDGDVVSDFCQAVDLDPDHYQRAPMVNRSLHERFNPLISRHRERLFTSVHDNEFYTFLEDLLGDAAYRDYSGSSLLTLSERRLVFSDHREANERLRADYFPDIEPEVGLFSPPTARDVHVTREPAMDPATELLYVAMFELYRRQSS
jgi:hypothetical protein